MKRLWHRHQVQLSIIVPYRAPRGSVRAQHWGWLRRYWRAELPGVEIIVADSPGRGVFSKTRAVNRAVHKSHGRILAVIDADAYLPGSVLQSIADRLDVTLAAGERRWFIPYRNLYRLKRVISEAIVHSDPHEPLRLPSPPPTAFVESVLGSMHGRRYGAMAVVYPREAFDLLGGMDPRFSGWGGEDVAFARALDTLYAKHKTTRNDVLHLWHPKIGDNYLNRQWEGQRTSQPNSHLADRYNRARGDRVRMRNLVEETP